MEDLRDHIIKFIRDTDSNVFITGKAGTGKTTLLQEISLISDPVPVVVAYTAAAALNAGGVTISSFFQMPRGPILPDGDAPAMLQRFAPDKLKLLRALDLLIIDEISMVRADMLDFLDRLLQIVKASAEPFGGVQVIVFGDLYQLPPVTNTDWPLLAPYYSSPYFFSSRVYRKFPFACFELEHVYRQKDPVFLVILNSIRQNSISDELLAALNERYTQLPTPDDYVTVTTHNRLVAEINTQRLDALPGEAFNYQAVVAGDYPRDAFPAEEILVLKKDALVIMTKNDPSGKQLYYNGRAAQIADLSASHINVRFLDDGSHFELSPEVWQHTTYTLEATQDKLTSADAGTFTQYPVKLAWAITVHKSQGLSFDKAVVDVSASFTHGQAYVALSRCRSLNGLILNSPVDRSSLITDPVVVTFLHSLPRLIADERNIPSAKAEKWAQWLRSQFYFPNLTREQQAFIPYLSEENRADLAELLNNAEKFLQKELNALPAGTMPGTDASLGMRLQAAADYFSPRLEKLATAFLSLIEGQAVDQRVNALTTQANVLLMECSLRHCFFKNILANESFETNRTALHKAVAAFQPKEEKKPTKETVLLHPQLHHKISEWRTEWSRSKGVPEHIILADKTLIAVANKAPRSLDELSAIAGVGPAKARSLGESLLKLIHWHFGARELF